MSGAVAVSEKLETRDQWIKRVLDIDPTSGGEQGQVGRDKLLGDIKRIKDEIDTQLAAAPRKPMALLDRVRYVESELKQFRSAVEKYNGPDKEKLGKAAEQLGTFLVSSRNNAMDRSADALSQEAGALHEEAMKVDKEIIAAIPGGGAKGIYPKVNKLLTRLTRTRDDWEAQVTEAGGELGGLQNRMTTGFGRLAQTEEHLNRMMLSCLPKLTSKIGTKPEGAPTGGGKVKEVTDPATAMTECGNDWVTAKETYGADPKQMQKLADFRKEVVNAWLNKRLNPWGMEEGPQKGWVAVGSTDPTSDYDISINKHGVKTKDGASEYYPDHKIVQDFNDYFRATYGIESGTLFDTNLYASAPSQAPAMPKEGTPEVLDAVADIKASADVGALMKTRRYMSSAEFEDYRVRTVGQMPDGPQRKALDRQFRAADANYMISLLDIVEKMRKQLNPDPPADESKLSEEQRAERAHARELIANWDKGQDVSGLALADAEGKLEELASELSHARDASTTATNDLYADAMGKQRGQEQAINKFQENLPEIKRLIAQAKQRDGAIDFDNLAGDLGKLGVQPRVLQHITKGDLDKAAKELDGQLAGMLSDLARHTAMSMFYANEAYQSGGPFQHVVWAGQAVESDTRAEFLNGGGTEAAWPPPPTKPTPEQQKLVDAKRKERRASLSPEESLQSFNEQLGDFLKDLEHYGDKDPGVAIIQSSKYLERLVDALRLMQDKKLFDTDEDLKGRIQKQLDLQSKLTGELIAARKGNLWMEPQDGGGEVNQVEQRRAYACDFMVNNYKITSVAALAKTYVKLGVEVNALARKVMATAR